MKWTSWIKVPTLLLSDTGDAVNPIDKRSREAAGRTSKLRRVLERQLHVEFMTQPKKWADIVDEWIKATVKR